MGMEQGQKAQSGGKLHPSHTLAICLTMGSVREDTTVLPAITVYIAPQHKTKIFAKPQTTLPKYFFPMKLMLRRS